MGITVRLVGLQPYLLEDIYRDPSQLDRTGDERVTAGGVDLDKAWAASSSCWAASRTLSAEAA